jgi:hypothetical protein
LEAFLIVKRQQNTTLTWLTGLAPSTPCPEPWLETMMTMDGSINASLGGRDKTCSYFRSLFFQGL